MTVNFVSVDIETTGFSQLYDSILSIGAVSIRNGKVESEFYELIYTGKKLTEKTTAITGLTNDMLKDAKTQHQVLTEFVDFIGDRPFVAHNAQFDHRFLKEKVMKYCKHVMLNPVICTVKATKNEVVNLPNYKLNTVANHFNIPNLKHHDALNDARVCADILLSLLGHEPVATRRESAMNKLLQKMYKPFVHKDIG